jgi:gluconokinase
MRNGIPLSDADRGPWLKNLQALIADRNTSGKNAVLACSALKRAYREELRVTPEVRVVYLQGTVELLRQRLHERLGHYMTEAMLDSQLAALEEPGDAVTVNIDQAPVAIVSQIRTMLRLTQS